MTHSEDYRDREEKAKALHIRYTNREIVTYDYMDQLQELGYTDRQIEDFVMEYYPKPIGTAE